MCKRKEEDEKQENTFDNILHCFNPKLHCRSGKFLARRR